ncbi:MAG: hypothetical protein IJZ72_06255 [Oscillospiraceae bacterium]|nr:hypothetical protein [Oscillospiraceae bacterium]
MANEFDLGLNIASIEAELPDPVITLTGSGGLTASETAEIPLLALTAYGRSWQGERVVNVSDVGITGYGIPVSSGGNYTDSSGQEWICDELIVNENGTGKIINRIASVELDGVINKVTGYVPDRPIVTVSLKNCKSYSTQQIADIYCNCFEAASASLIYNGNVGAAINQTSLWLNIDNTISDVESANLWLNDNPITVIYPLAASTETELTAEQLAALQPLINKYEAFTAYFMSAQDGTPTPENPVEIVSAADLHRVSVAIESVGDNGSVNVNTYGKNLINIDSEYYHANKGYVLNFIPIILELGKTYTFSFVPNKSISNAAQIILRNAAGNAVINSGSLSFVANEQIVFTFVVDENVADLAFYVNASDITLLNIQLEKSDTVTKYEPYKSTTAKITTALPLRGIPVSSGGNYTDSDGQEWICDTLEHNYGEPAQVVKRIKYGKAEPYYDLKGGNAIAVEYIYDGTDENGQNKLAGYRHYIGEYGKTSTYLTAYWANVYNCFYKIEYDLDGNITSETAVEPYTASPYLQSIHELVGEWTLNHGSLMIQTVLPAYVLPGRVTAEYISTTGALLTADSDVAYVSKPESVLLTTEETEALNGLSGFTGSTTVYNDSTAEMTVKLLREDFEMQYIHWIKESQSFVCEKSGKYKIICVGGGSSGGIGAAGAAETLQAVGTTTSFGNIISADGGEKSRALMPTLQIGDGALVGGQSGYDGINYGSTAHVMAYESAVHFSSSGGSSSVMWGTGHGYGAGGGARGYSDDLAAAGGRCGKVESTIVDLEENQTVACTIGGGGVLVLSDENVLEYLKNYVDPETASASGMGEKISACVSNGADGVIVIQYLGL